MPKFKNEDEEAEFWANHDFTEYFNNTNQIQAEMVNLKPSTQSITIRLPQTMLRQLKIAANKRDVPYQSLLKILLSEKLKEQATV